LSLTLPSHFEHKIKQMLAGVGKGENILNKVLTSGGRAVIVNLSSAFIFGLCVLLRCLTAATTADGCGVVAGLSEKSQE
jgi:hypothetical protein